MADEGLLAPLRTRMLLALLFLLVLIAIAGALFIHGRAAAPIAPLDIANGTTTPGLSGYTPAVMTDPTVCGNSLPIPEPTIPTPITDTDLFSPEIAYSPEDAVRIVAPNASDPRTGVLAPQTSQEIILYELDGQIRWALTGDWWNCKIISEGNPPNSLTTTMTKLGLAYQQNDRIELQTMDASGTFPRVADPDALRFLPEGNATSSEYLSDGKQIYLLAISENGDSTNEAVTGVTLSVVAGADPSTFQALSDDPPVGKDAESVYLGAAPASTGLAALRGRGGLGVHAAKYQADIKAMYPSNSMASR